MSELFFYSYNLNKIKEVLKILKNNKTKILTLNDFPKIYEPNETGKTFIENAKIKSQFGFKKFGLPCFADDSGICISALNNKPGVMSKRFIEENGGLKRTFDIIINQTIKSNNFNAFFKTAIALTTKKNNTICFQGIVKGKISNKPLGTQGFHYDKIFIPNGIDKTYAQMTSKAKNKISHRSIAIKKLNRFLEKTI